MKINKLSIVIETCILLCLTLFLIFDSFPNLTSLQFISVGITKWIIFLLFISSVIFFRKDNLNEVQSLKLLICLSLYFICLIALLSFLGGQSSSGITFGNFEFWLVFILSVIGIWKEYKKTTKPSSLKFFLVTALFTLIIISFQFWNDHRERNLAELIQLNPHDFVLIGFTMNKIPEEMPYEWITEKVKPANELIGYFGKYRVKRITEKEYNKALPEEKFEFTISHKTIPSSIVFGTKNYLHILHKGYYKVINGPIDMKWIRSYSEKYRKQYQE